MGRLLRRSGKMGGSRRIGIWQRCRMRYPKLQRLRRAATWRAGIQETDGSVVGIPGKWSHRLGYCHRGRVMPESIYRKLPSSCTLERPREHRNQYTLWKRCFGEYTKRRPKIEVIRHVKLKAQRRPMTSTRRPNPRAPTLPNLLARQRMSV